MTNSWSQRNIYLHIAEEGDDADPKFKALLSVKSDKNKGKKDGYVPLGAVFRHLSENDPASIREILLKRIRDASFEHQEFTFFENQNILAKSCDLTHDQVYAIFDNIHQLEQNHFILRLPKKWCSAPPKRVQLQVDVKKDQPSRFGLHALLKVQKAFKAGDQMLSKQDWQKLQTHHSGLMKIRGEWVMADRQQLNLMLHNWQYLESLNKEQGIPFGLALRIISGWQRSASGKEMSGKDVQLPTLELLLQGMRESIDKVDVKQRLEYYQSQYQFKLRDYQRHGVKWMTHNILAGIGSLLADDMGLGKTVQVISTIQLLVQSQHLDKILIVAPAALMANWQREFAKFAPKLKVTLAHRAYGYDGKVEDGRIYITTYATLQRLDQLHTQEWDLIVLDEAQKIKNADSKTSSAVRGLNARARLAMTGTPIENSIGDLWSIFEFLNPGLLGARQEFLAHGQSANPSQRFDVLRKMMAPFVLKRGKSEGEIAKQLPEKIVKNHFVNLSPLQVALYRDCLSQMKEEVKSASGKFVILPYLMDLKKICNHPSQFLQDGSLKGEDSSKFKMLLDLAESIVGAQEKFIVFTQFASICDDLVGYLNQELEVAGTAITGSMSPHRRQSIIDEFQKDPDQHFLVLSLHASGVGLNITAANHVIHFDRWWNPAVENQATDRAHRIGQSKTVIVHKLITSGTIEDRIHELIKEKVSLAESIFKDFQSESVLKMAPEEWLDMAQFRGPEPQEVEV